MVSVGKICIFITEQSKKGKSKNQVRVDYKNNVNIANIYSKTKNHEFTRIYTHKNPLCGIL